MEKLAQTAIGIINELHTERLDYNSEYIPLINAAMKLEDLEEILGDEYDLNRLAELVKADKEGRCVTLPCKIGDKVYFIRSHFNKYCEIPLEANVHRIIIEKAETIFKTVTKGGLDRNFYQRDIGKTVFLTYEQAEKALKEMRAEI